VVSNIFSPNTGTYSKSPDSSVGIATGYRLGGRGSIPDRGQIFLFSTASKPAIGPTQPPTQYAAGDPSPEIKRPGREAEHPPQSSVEVKNGGAIPPLPHVFTAQCLIH
jgi:hypothetical protein